MNDKIYVVMPEEYARMIEKFLEKIKEQGIVSNYFHNKEEREFVVHLDPDAKIPGDKEDLISHGIFFNSKEILKDLGVEDIDEKLVQLPMSSVAVDERNENVIRINY